MILPQLEQQGLYNQIDFNKHMQDQTVQVVTTVVSVYICPSDADSGNAVLDNRSPDNPVRAAGLWYTGSMGPTMPDLCPLCNPPGNPPPPCPSPGNFCCQGHNFGTSPGGGYPAGELGRNVWPLP